MTAHVTWDPAPRFAPTTARASAPAGRHAELTGTLRELARLLEYASAPETDLDAHLEDLLGAGRPVHGDSPADLLDRLIRLAEGTAEIYPRLAEALLRHGTGAVRSSGGAGAGRERPGRDPGTDIEAVAKHLEHATELAGDMATHLLQARNHLA